MGLTIAWLVAPVAPLLGAKVAVVGALLFVAIERLKAGGEGDRSL